MIKPVNKISNSVSTSVTPDGGSSLQTVEAQIIQIQSDITTLQNQMAALGVSVETVDLTATNATIGEIDATTVNVSENATVSKKLTVLGTSGLEVQYGIKCASEEITGTLTDKNGSTGIAGQLLYSSGDGIYWGNVGDIGTFNSLVVAETSQLRGETTIGLSGTPAALIHYGTSTHTGAVNITGDVTITGNITQNGSSYITHAQEVYTTNDFIVMRDGATGGLASGSYSGFKVTLYDGANNGILGIDNTGTARVGDSGNEQPLATRAEAGSMISGGLVQWDAANVRIKPAADVGSVGVPVYITGSVATACAGDSTPVNGSANFATSGALYTEQTARTSADTTLQNNITSEQIARTNADNSLSSSISTLDSAALHKTGAETASGLKSFTDGIKTKTQAITQIKADVLLSKTANADLYVKLCTIPYNYIGELSVYLYGAQVSDRIDINIALNFADNNARRSLIVNYSKVWSDNGFDHLYIQNGTSTGEITLNAKFIGTETGTYTCRIYEHRHDGESGSVTPFITVIDMGSVDTTIALSGNQGMVAPANLNVYSITGNMYQVYHAGNADTTPISGSTNGITSGAVYSALAGGFTGYVAGSGNGLPYSHGHDDFYNVYARLNVSLPAVGDWCQVSGYGSQNDSEGTILYSFIPAYAIKTDTDTIKLYTSQTPFNVMSGFYFQDKTFTLTTDLISDRFRGQISW